jgi:hypothetical protein
MRPFSSIFRRSQPDQYISVRNSEEYTDDVGLLKEEANSSSSMANSPVSSPYDTHEARLDPDCIRSSYTARIPIILNALFFCLSTFLFATSFLVRGQGNEFRGRNYLLKQTSEPCKFLPKPICKNLYLILCQRRY